jgi:hypothetical protein
MPKRQWAWVLLATTLAVPAFALTTKSIADGLTAADVAAAVTGPGATISNVRITGSSLSIGTFSEGGLGIASGIILSSGNVATAIGPNNQAGAGEDVGTPGDGQLNTIVSPNTTHDAAILEFDVVTTTPVFTISYVFGSEEYREYVDKEFNDVFAFYVDGANIALTPGSNNPVTIDTINHLRNTSLYRDNETGTNTQLDGFTVPLLAVAFVEPHVTHHIKIAIADAGDSILDSAVFIEQGGVSGTTAPILIPPVSSLAATVGETLNVPIPIYFVFDDIPYTLSASGVPGATTSFSEVYVKDGQQYVDMKLVLGAGAQAGAHVLTIHSTTGEAQRFATIYIVVDCQAPQILGIGQPVSQSVNTGTSATLTVQAAGSGPFSYQWYQGHPGMTNSPVSGATGSTFTTPAVSARTPYWVRVTNACGTYDSLVAYASPR